MSIQDKTYYKTRFKQELDRFVQELKLHISTSNGEWSVKGFIDVYKNIYTISSDTKIISKILEIHIFPHLLQFAAEIGYNIVLTSHQNYYPDITFINQENENVKFAVDIKTTYRRNNGLLGFTLGSHGAYFKERDKKKNIQFPYNQYLGHYCLGVIYTRIVAADNITDTETYNVQELSDNAHLLASPSNTRRIIPVENLHSITSVIKDFDFFAAEKWKIASDKQGSGNTANIGTLMSIEDLRAENGIFSQLGEEWFDEYWINFGSAMIIKDGKPHKVNNLRDFLDFKGRTDLWKKISSKNAGKELL